jgi:membrane-bound lytic murein transglycosylase D
LLLVLALAGCATVAPPNDAGTPGMTTTLPSAETAPPSPGSAASARTEAAAATPAVPAGATALAAAEPAPVLIDPPHIGDDSDLWERLRRGYAIPDLDTDLVRRWERYYAGRPDYVRRMTERGSRYLFHVVEEIERRDMPADLALLPFIESAFDPQALSRARASGMWQFMPATGRDFELRQNLFRDDRRSVLASTQAALDYLQRLHRQFGDWHLALAAYNWGQGNVQRAIRRNAAAGLPTDYLSLRMPEETRNYVPKLQAVKNIVSRPAEFGLALPALENHPFFLGVPIVRDIDVALAAQLAGMPLAEFQALNPQMNKPVILAAGTPHVLLPYAAAHRFAQALAEHRGPLASWTAWIAPRTLAPADAAKLVGMSEARLREVNRIPPRMRVQAGSALLVPRAPHADNDVAAHVANHGVLALAPEPRAARRVVFTAGPKGDSVGAVARRYRVQAQQVASWNRVGPQARFAPGARIVVMLPPRQARAPVRQATAPARPARAAGAPARPARAASARAQPARAATAPARQARTAAARAETAVR